MSRYYQRPLIVDAFRLGYDERPEWFKQMQNTGEVKMKRTIGFVSYDSATIIQGDTWYTAEHGDWIINGLDGEVTVLSNKDFERLYAPYVERESE